MKVLVPLKRVPDYEAKIKILEDGSGIKTEGIKWIANPFDEIAVEEALKIKENGKAEEVVVAGIGPKEAEAQLRFGLAMGADRGILVVHDGHIDSDLASRVLEKVYQREDFGLILMGKQAIDSDSGQTPQLLAARLGLPQACFASKIVLEDESASVTREVDGGLETIRIKTPCVISADLRLNEPRYASLPGIMKAKKKPIEEIRIEELGVEVSAKVDVVKLSPPSKRQGGRIVESVEELVTLLRDEAKVL